MKLACNWDRRRRWRRNLYAQSLVTEIDEDVRLLVVNAPFFNSASVFFWFLSSRSPLWFLCVFVFSLLFFSVLVPPGILGAALCVVRPVLSFLFFSLLVPPLSGFLFFSPFFLFLIFQFLSSLFFTSSLCFPSLFNPFGRGLSLAFIRPENAMRW